MQPFVTPNTLGMGAEVNAPALVRLFDEAGREISVPAQDAAYWLTAGFHTEAQRDPALLWQECRAYIEATKLAIEELVVGVVQDGTLDHSDEAAYASARLALRQFEVAWGALEKRLLQFPRASEAASVRLQKGTGAEAVFISVDPGQVELYGADGWKVAGGK